MTMMPQVQNSQIAGFSNPTATSIRSLFIAAPSAVNDGLASYLLEEDGGRTYVPNAQQCTIDEVRVVTQDSESYGQSLKLVVIVTNAHTGDRYAYRCGVSSWAATGFLRSMAAMNDQQLNGTVEIRLAPTAKTTFCNFFAEDENGTMRPVRTDNTAGKVHEDSLEEIVAGLNERLGLIGDDLADEEPEPVAPEVQPEPVADPIADMAQPKTRRSKTAARKPKAAAVREELKEDF